MRLRPSMNKKALIISLLVYFGINLPFVVARNTENSHIDYVTETLMHPLRASKLQPDRIVKILNIQPGAHIVDIGAGAGFFTFRFAKALNGTGKVFATDTDPAIIKYLKQKAEKDKYQNVFPIQVTSDGLDSFYRRHSFDIIFICHVLLHEINSDPKAADFFKNLGLSLVKEKGRLYIYYAKYEIHFNELEEFDFNELIESIIAEGKEFPVFKKLGAETKDFIKNWRGNSVPFEMKIKIVEDFDEMISDESFFDDLSNYSLSKDGEKSRRLDFFRHEERLKMMKIMKNKLALGWFIPNVSIFFPVKPKKEAIIAKMQTFGYRFVRGYDFIPQECFLLEFKMKN